MTVVETPAITACPACGAELSGKYCANCGQRAGVRILSVRALLREVVEDQFSVNATLPRTLIALFCRPGFLTTEYLRQRLSLYVPPFRLYLVASLVFFVIVSFETSQDKLTVEDYAEIDSARAALRDTAAAREARGEAPPSVPWGLRFDPTEPNWADKAQIRLGNEWLERVVRARLKKLEAMPPEDAIRRMIAGMMSTIPKVMFLLLPLYALILKVLYIRRRRLYVEHFIFSLHIHAFAFGLFVLMTATSTLPVVPALLGVWLVLYSWLAMRRVYGQGWIRTTLKWFVLGQSYAIAVAVGLLISMAAAAFTI